MLPDLVEVLSRFSFEISELKTHSVVIGQLLLVPVEEIPVERSEGTGFVAGRLFRVVAAVGAIVSHFVNVVAAGTVGFGCQDPAVGELRHPDHVGSGNPIDGVAVGGDVPVVELLGVHAV